MPWYIWVLLIIGGCFFLFWRLCKSALIKENTYDSNDPAYSIYEDELVAIVTLERYTSNKQKDTPKSRHDCDHCHREICEGCPLYKPRKFNFK